MVAAAHVVGEPVNFPARVDEDNTLSDGKGLVEVAESVQLVVFFVHVDVELLDTFQC